MATQREVAEHLFLEASGRQVRNWHKQPGFPIPVGKGGYDLVEVRKWYIAYLKNHQIKNAVPNDPEENDIELERFLLTREKRISEELKNASKEGKLIPVDAAREVLAKICSQIGAVLDSLPLNIKRNHPELDNKIIIGIKSLVIASQNSAAQLDVFIDEILDDFISESETKV